MGRHVALVGRDDHRTDVVGKAIWDSPRGDSHRVIVEDDVWIGHGAIVVAGVTVGRGSVVAAGSVVTRSIPRYAVAAGVPAKVVKFRFDEEQIQEHERLLGYSEPTARGYQSEHR
jgi:acetyltransferase-like isoleucine patch superfamily enzyme